MATETLRPNTAGDETALLPTPGTGEANWEDVDEVVADDDTTRVRQNSATNNWERDLYNLPAHSGSGTINSITVYARCKVSTGAVPDQTNLKIALKTGGTAYEGSEVQLTTSYVNYSSQWNTNPQTGVAWTWGDIDALQTGVSLRKAQSDSSYTTRCTQVWVVVDYSDAVPKTSSDSGAGVDSTPAPSASLSGSESGSSIETLAARLMASFDIGTAIEVSSLFHDLFQNLFASELGEGLDLLVAKIEMPTKGGGMKLWT
jgi:hypothetical protein